MNCFPRRCSTEIQEIFPFEMVQNIMYTKVMYYIPMELCFVYHHWFTFLKVIKSWYNIRRYCTFATMFWSITSILYQDSFRVTLPGTKMIHWNRIEIQYTKSTITGRKWSSESRALPASVENQHSEVVEVYQALPKLTLHLHQASSSAPHRDFSDDLVSQWLPPTQGHPLPIDWYRPDPAWSPSFFYYKN